MTDFVWAQAQDSTTDSTTDSTDRWDHRRTVVIVGNLPGAGVVVNAEGVLSIKREVDTTGRLIASVAERRSRRSAVNWHVPANCERSR